MMTLTNAETNVKNVQPELTQERLQELLNYDAETGLFTWKVRRQRIRMGDVAGTLQTIGYLQIMVDGRLYLAHRLAWLYTYGTWPKFEIDHKDHNKANNAIDNLQDIPHGGNQSRKKAYGAIKLKGVHLNKGKFRAQIRIDGKKKHLGYFATPEEAHAAWAEAAKELHGDNFFCDCDDHKV